MRKSLRRRLGWTRSQAQQVEFIAQTTRDTQKHNVLGMRLGLRGEREGEHFIIVFDRSGLTVRSVAESDDLGDRKTQLEVYRDLSIELGLPPHCEECKIAATGEVTGGFFDELEDDEYTWDTDEDGSTWLTDEDDESGWDTDDNDGWE